MVMGAGTLSIGTAVAAGEADRGGAGAADLSDLNLEDLLRLKVVTASGGVAEESDLAPANVFTVLASEIANQGWHSVSEVLEHVPGLYVVDDYVTHNVGVRGASGGLRAGSRIMKVMINGTDVSFRPDLNALIGPEFIPIDVVERIEIARGPLSALYGANAFLATVNVVTIDPDHVGGRVSANGSARPQGGSTRLGGGGSGVFTGRAGERLKFLLSASYDRLDRGGLTIQQTFPSQNMTNSPHLGETSGTDLARPASIFGRLTGGSGSLGDFSLQGGLQQVDSRGDFQLGSVLTGQTREALRNVWVEGQHNGHWTDVFSSQVSVGYAHGAPTGSDQLYVTDNGAGFGSFYTRNFSYDAVDGKLALTVTPRAHLRLSAGVDTSWEGHNTLFYSQHFLVSDGVHNPGDVVDIIPADGRRNVTVTKLAPNLHASFDPVPSVRLSADGRIDFTNLFDKQLSWRAAAGWRILPNLVAKVIGGRAFQTPSTVFLFAYPGFGTADIIGSRNLANSSLVPQVVQSGEAVVNYVQGQRLSVNVAGYLQSITDQITFATTGPNYVARNQGTANSVGSELNVTARLWRLEPYLRLSQQWFLDHPGRSPLDRGPDVPPAFIPARWAMAGLRATVPSPRLTFDATWRIVGERGASQSNIFLNNGQSYALPGYQQVDLAATATFNPLGKGYDTRAFVSVRNILDERHSEPGFGGIDVPSLGRTFQLALSQTF
jgi:outer membrane receptor protein involved in Fe transport